MDAKRTVRELLERLPDDCSVEAFEAERPVVHETLLGRHIII